MNELNEISEIIFYSQMYLDKFLPYVNLFIAFSIDTIIIRKVYDIVIEKYNNFIDKEMYVNNN